MATFVQTLSGQSTTSPWPQAKSEMITAPVASDLRQLEIQHNALMNNIAAYLSATSGDAAITTATPTIGTTVTATYPAQIICIAGVPASLSADSNKAFGALGTIPASKWGLIAIDRIAAGTTSFVSAAANYTTGYDTEALAIAAMPAKTASKARVAYITILASASTWIAGTDALAGGTGGNPATTTNYYGVYGTNDTLFWTSSQIANRAGTVLTSANY